jgi:hypothetical protein
MSLAMVEDYSKGYRSVEACMRCHEEARRKRTRNLICILIQIP